MGTGHRLLVIEQRSDWQPGNGPGWASGRPSRWALGQPSLPGVSKAGPGWARGNRLVGYSTTGPEWATLGNGLAWHPKNRPGWAPGQPVLLGYSKTVPGWAPWAPVPGLGIPNDVPNGQPGAPSWIGESRPSRWHWARSAWYRQRPMGTGTVLFGIQDVRWAPGHVCWYRRPSEWHLGPSWWDSTPVPMGHLGNRLGLGISKNRSRMGTLGPPFLFGAF